MSNFARRLEELRKELEDLQSTASINKSNQITDSLEYRYYCGRLDAYWHVLNIVKQIQQKGE